MSLVSSDSEGEQNELRNLQEKLESTMKLVSNLSSQLSELKDQVRDIPNIVAADRARDTSWKALELFRHFWKLRNIYFRHIDKAGYDIRIHTAEWEIEDRETRCASNSCRHGCSGGCGGWDSGMPHQTNQATSSCTSGLMLKC